MESTGYRRSLAAFGFILSGLLFTLETQEKWYKPAFHVLGWTYRGLELQLEVSDSPFVVHSDQRLRTPVWSTRLRLLPSGDLGLS
jgi:hypothetical protein